MSDTSEHRAAYGGEGWSPRTASLRDELGTIWEACGKRSEWEPLGGVLLHRPGEELRTVEDPDEALMLEPPDPDRAGKQHDGLAAAYREAGVEVVYVEPSRLPTPNLMFCADLFFMTSEGAVVARPASIARAGEERWVQRRLADLGVPVLRSVGGRGTFEGADALWIDEETVLLAVGLRTNEEGARQVAGTLAELGVSTVQVELPPGTMHLMGQLQIVDRNLAYFWEGRLPEKGLETLRSRGYRRLPFPDLEEARTRFAHNFVTLGPREILMPADCPNSRRAYEAEGVRCREIEVGEITRAAGGIGCLTGILRRG